ncbi:MAG: NAD-dependent epimerase/dehydratase family protein, partial [Pirellulales bacterium]|nr:NAD-dependent epimerase/dehydratase family protein [Pirellulales bacterium]
MLMASVLVTGAGGFIGTVLVRQLRERGDDVVCLAHHSHYAKHFEAIGARVAIGDIRSLDSLRQATQGVECVY